MEPGAGPISGSTFLSGPPGDCGCTALQPSLGHFQASGLPARSLTDENRKGGESSPNCTNGSLAERQPAFVPGPEGVASAPCEPFGVAPGSWRARQPGVLAVCGPPAALDGVVPPDARSIWGAVASMQHRRSERSRQVVASTTGGRPGRVGFVAKRRLGRHDQRFTDEPVGRPRH